MRIIGKYFSRSFRFYPFQWTQGDDRVFEVCKTTVFVPLKSHIGQRTSSLCLSNPEQFCPQLLVFWNRALFGSLGCFGIHCATQAGLRFTAILLSWCPNAGIVGRNHRTLHFLSFTHIELTFIQNYCSTDSSGWNLPGLLIAGLLAPRLALSSECVWSISILLNNVCVMLPTCKWMCFQRNTLGSPG